MKYHIKLLVLSIIFVLTSCSDHHKIKRTMSEFTKSKIVLTDGLYVVKDRTYSPANIDDLRDMKLIMYIDSLSCSQCRISHLNSLLALYEFAVSDNRFSVLTIFSPRSQDLPDVVQRIILQDFPYPLYVDVDGEFARRNVIPKDLRFHNFLIDSEGKLRFVGNPNDNDQLMTIFLKAL